MKINHLVVNVTIEVEVKFRVANLEDVEYKLLEWGAKLVEIVVQRDHYFNHPSRDFAKSDEALRIREEGELVYITYKGPKFDSKSKTRKEIEFKISQRDEANEMLQLLGFERVLVVSTQRREYKLDEITWCLDEVDGLGFFIELEKMIKSKKETKQVLAEMFRIVKKIDLNPDDNITKSYMELILERK